MLLDQQSADLSTVFVAHLAQLRRVALNIVRNPERAEDIVQDAYIKATEAAGILNIKQPLAYLLQMVRNLAIDRHRHLHAAVRHRNDGNLIGLKTGRVERVQNLRLDELVSLDTGGTDGRVGNDTMLAVRNFQKKAGMTPADGYAGLKLLARLRQGV